MNESRARTPFLVILVSILMVIAGAISLIGGILLFLNKDDEEILADVDVTSGQLQTIAIVVIVVAALTLLVAIGLARGTRLARGLVTIVMLLNIAAGIYGLHRARRSRLVAPRLTDRMGRDRARHPLCTARLTPRVQELTVGQIPSVRCSAAS